ncbi:NAD(P)/FAD-dependent oxidoreductase [Paenibacillus sp. LHD-117]|uniref:NAD(P)/FAD-dependent oxidoreductase n=1 Tax=Paenibacillus sp. LHD-117 TaxID=3071412 RepID=UPI0027E15B76|nr:NAD(P)/FAD-dependent oxidoreductase [Paenibacillus sp. LHD-117]MDQ6422921.1 NAD(P)/FAD-dependent oxidoreductase [Paenibacillus sp. LHD-117]
MSIQALNERVKQDLYYLAYGGAEWVRPIKAEGEHVYDVVIVGGGQSGLGLAFGLLRERIANILVIDENPEGLEGPWDTYARMVTLRTPKHLTSVDLGIPSLTFRSWWEAQTGEEGWAKVDKIPRGEWMNYLRWYRKVLGLPVANEAKLKLIEPVREGLHRLHLEGTGAPAERLLARKVVLATGIQGGGEWHVPPLIQQKVPRRFYAHTSEPIDFERLRGKRVAVLGGGASAFDNAQFALSEGVAEAHVFVRRAKLPRINPIRQMESSGMIERYPALSDADKYAVMSHFYKHNQPPTNDTFARAAAYPGFHLHLGSPWLDTRLEEGAVVIVTPQGEFCFDFLIVSTGLVSDPTLRPELLLVEGDIARWSDRYEAPPEVASPMLDAHPYLSSGFAFTGRSEEGQRRLHGLFAFNYSVMVSCGLSASAISGMRFAVPRLASSIADQLFMDDKNAILTDFYAYEDAEFSGEWTPRAQTQDEIGYSAG